MVARRQFEDAGYTVEHVATADAAIRVCYDRTPDLVVLDQNLGEDSGTSVCRRIKSDLTLSVIPVLVLTASDRERDHIEALEAGGDAFLPKGSPWPDVLAVVGRLLATHAAWRPAASSGPDAPAGTHRTRVLTVDDSPTYLELLCQGLTNAGFATTRRRRRGRAAAPGAATLRSGRQRRRHARHGRIRILPPRPPLAARGASPAGALGLDGRRAERRLDSGPRGGRMITSASPRTSI